MQCLSCGSDLPDGALACPECGLMPPLPEGGRRKRTERARRRWLSMALLAAAAILLLGAAAGTVVVLLVVPQSRPAPRPPVTIPRAARSAKPATATPSPAADASAAATAVVRFYEAIDTWDATAVAAAVTTGTRPAVALSALDDWSLTTFSAVRSEVESDTALVFGHETRQAFGSRTLGVKFTLVRAGGSWLVQSWQPADEGIVNGAVPSTGAGAGATSLTSSTARDLVETLLQARQLGDSGTIRLLTTAKFQTEHGAVWLDGVDNSLTFTRFIVKSIKRKAATFAVTVSERWASGTEVATYTVVEASGTVLVDARTSK